MNAFDSKDNNKTKLSELYAAECQSRSFWSTTENIKFCELESTRCTTGHNSFVKFRASYWQFRKQQN